MSFRITFEGVEKEIYSEKIVYRESELSGDFGEEIREIKKRKEQTKGRGNLLVVLLKVWEIKLS